jgi:hypothetical protein
MTVRYYRIAMSVLAIARNVEAQEKKIDRSALPPTVEKALQSETRNATIKGFRRGA